jgi:hypothetical protein
MNNSLFGKVNSPAPIGQNPSADLGNLIAVIISLVFTVAGIVALIYGMWGALNWITSGGDKEKLMKAQARIRNALIGVFILVVVFAAFVTIFTGILGCSIICYKNGALEFTIPRLGTGTGPGGCQNGGVMDPNGVCQPP